MRVRVSTTVDAARLDACRRRLRVPDSQLLDRALDALLDALEADVELAALEASPYDRDPELAWQSPPLGTGLTYDGEVPAEIRRAAARQRRQRSGHER